MKFLLLILLISTNAFANDSFEFRAESLIREGKLVDAEKWVKSTEMSKESSLRLLGRISMLENNETQAEEYFDDYLKLSKRPLEKVLMMSTQIALKKKNPRKALLLLSKIKKPSIQKDILFSQSLWDMNKKNEAVTHLNKTKSHKYEDYDLIERQKYYFLYEMGLIKKLFKESKKYLATKDSSSEAGLYVVSLLKEKDLFLAETYFDALLSLKPSDALVLRERGVFELEKKRTYLASIFLSKAAHLNSEYSFDAASAHLSLGHHAEAVFFNSRVSNQTKKVQQLFTIYLDAQNYEKALSLKYELQKQNLLNDDKISYALLYVAFKSRDYKTFNSLFSKVSSKIYLSKVLKLKEIVESCKSNLELACVFS